MVIKKRVKVKPHHIYIATVINTSVVCLATLHFTNGCMVSLAFFGGAGSTMVMIALVHIFNDRIEQDERKNGEEYESEN